MEVELEDYKRTEEEQALMPPPAYKPPTHAVERVPRRSPSPDIREVLMEEDDEINKEPVLIRIPQLNAPLAFTPAALKNWGRVHEDQSAQAIQFREQLKEWKNTKQDLRKIMAQAYEDTRELKEYVVSNEVTQEHLYALHMQVKHTAKRVRTASQNVDLLISIALKQMTLNVDAVRDFGTVLRAIPFDTLEVQDFYRSIRSFYVGLMERLTQKHGKNNPFILNIAHSFEHFLQTCDFLKPLPGSLTQFTGMMASIIRDVYDIDMDALKKVSREMKADLVEKERRMELVLKEKKGDLGICEGEAGPSTKVEEDSLEPILSKEELKAVMREAHLKSVREKEAKEDTYYEARAGSILGRISGEAGHARNDVGICTGNEAG